MTTVLVTGGAGFIATHTDIELLNKGYDVISVDNYGNSSPVALERVEQITGKPVKRYDGDVRDEALMERVFAENNIDWVIHFAGLKAVGESVAKPIEYYDNNLYSTLVLLKVMKKHNVKKIIFSSSATVYGTPKELPITEETPTGGTTNPYGTSKLFQEQILRDVHVADPSWTIVLLRYFNPVGAHESGLLGEDPKGIPANLTPYVAKVAVGELKEVQVYGDDYDTPDGTGVRDYIHVVDLAKGHVAVIDHIDKEGVFVYNLGTGHGYSVLEVIKAYDGYEVLEYLESHDADLLIIDVMMPGLDGIRTTLKVRENSSIPIIILSAKSEDTDKILGLNIGADDYITKPFNMEVLKLRINKIIEMNVKRQEIFNQDIKIEPMNNIIADKVSINLFCFCDQAAGGKSHPDCRGQYQRNRVFRRGACQQPEYITQLFLQEND